MTEKARKKKVNNLTIKECEDILQRLSKSKESLYYQHVLTHYRKLLPNMGSAVLLNKVTIEQGNTSKHITSNNK